MPPASAICLSARWIGLFSASHTVLRTGGPFPISLGLGAVVVPLLDDLTSPIVQENSEQARRDTTGRKPGQRNRQCSGPLDLERDFLRAGHRVEYLIPLAPQQFLNALGTLQNIRQPSGGPRRKLIGKLLLHDAGGKENSELLPGGTGLDRV